MRAALLSLSLILFCLVGCASCKKQGAQRRSDVPADERSQVFEKVTAGAASYKYLLFLPEDYARNKRLWPTMIFLHGIGNRGDDLDKVKTSGVPKVVQRRRHFPFVLVAPQCPQKQWWSSELLTKLVDQVANTYAVDSQRFYLTGLSMGGFGTWDLACAYPDRFAAIAPICGGGEPNDACRLKNVPVWAFHGARDETVPLRRSREMVEAVKACGGDARLTVYPEAGHDSWTTTYDNNDLYDWFLQHPKKRKSN